MKIVVIGGTGLIGSKLVANLREQGHKAVAASPRTGVNAVTGEGLAEALEGASVVVDVSNPPTLEGSAAREFFETSGRNLLAAEGEAGVGHHVVLTIVGMEELPGNPYFRAKVVQENLVEESSIPFSLVAATQFFEFTKSIADEATDDDKVRVAPVLFQPIAGDDVARAIGRVSVGEPLNGRVEVAGPEQFQMDEFFREALASWGDPREVVTDPHADYFGTELRERSLVPDDGAALGAIRYRDWR